MSTLSKGAEKTREITHIRAYTRSRSTDYYPICPTCGLDIEYDYQRYCIFCGQALGWRKIRYASIIPCRAELFADDLTHNGH